MYLYLIFGVNFWSLASMVENSLSAFKRDLAVITDAKYTELFYSLVNNTLDLFIVERFVCVWLCACADYLNFVLFPSLISMFMPWQCFHCHLEFCLEFLAKEHYSEC